METAPLLDQSTIGRLQDLARDVAAPGEDVLGDLLKTFANDLSVRLAELDQALALGDLPGAAEAAHAMKGACLTIGAQQMATLTTEAETALRAGTALPDLMAHARALADQTIAALTVAFAPDR